MTHPTYQHEESLHSLCADRRTRSRIPARQEIKCQLRGHKGLPRVIECTSSGARVILTREPRPGGVLDLKLSPNGCTLHGKARVAWVEQLGKERWVAGLSFLNIRVPA